MTLSYRKRSAAKAEWAAEHREAGETEKTIPHCANETVDRIRLDNAGNRDAERYRKGDDERDRPRRGIDPEVVCEVARGPSRDG